MADSLGPAARTSGEEVMIVRAVASRSVATNLPKLYLIDEAGLVSAVLEMVETTVVLDTEKDEILREIVEAINERADRERDGRMT